MVPGQQPLPQHDQDKEMIVDYRKRRTLHTPILIDGAVVEQFGNFKFLGVHITNKLTWSKYTKTVVKREQQNRFPLRRLNRFGMGSSDPQKVLQLHHREHPDSLHHCLVWQLHLRPQATTEGSACDPVHPWSQAF